MFILILRELLLWAAVLVLIWWVWDKIITIVRRDSRKELIKQRLDSISEIEELSEMSEVDVKRLQKAREKLKQIEREGKLWL